MERQIFPEMHILPRVERAADFIKRVWNLGRETELCLSEHRRNEE